MNTVRLVLIAIGMGLAAVLTAGAHSSPLNPHPGHTAVAPGGLFLNTRAAADAGYGPLLGCVSGQQDPRR